MPSALAACVVSACMRLACARSCRSALARSTAAASPMAASKSVCSVRICAEREGAEESADVQMHKIRGRKRSFTHIFYLCHGKQQKYRVTVEPNVCDYALLIANDVGQLLVNDGLTRISDTVPDRPSNACARRVHPCARERWPRARHATNAGSHSRSHLRRCSNSHLSVSENQCSREWWFGSRQQRQK